MKGFQEHGKDIDREILLNMDNDKDLLKACSLNKYLLNEVCDDMFFKNRLLKTYPNTLKYKELDTIRNNFKKLTWKQYFLQVIYYVWKMKEDYQYEYTNGNFKTQYKIFKQSKGDIDKLLIYSSKYGELDLVKEALMRGADIRENGDTALSYAVDEGFIDIFKYLAEHGANIHGNYSYSLRMASKFGHLEIVKYLVEHGANINAEEDAALILAIRYQNYDIVKYLIEHGAHINTDMINMDSLLPKLL